MKKFICVIIFLAVGLNSIHAQGDIRLGVNAGIPVGDISDASDLNIGADVAYLLGFDMFQAGPMIGYNRFLVKDFDDVSFLPIAGTARFGLAGLELGADVGYALGLTEGLDGGFYYRPKIGFSLFGLGLIGSYTGISVDGATYSSVNIGAEFRL